MALEAATVDCSLITDSEIEELAAMCESQTHPFSVGFLSKEAESWVLLTRISEKGSLKGFSFYTLERLGGTPCVIFGATSILPFPKRGTVQKQIVKEQLKKAIMAFPDEEVLFGAKLSEFSSLDFFKGFTDLIPKPDHKSNGEERAWGCRLAAKYGIGAKEYDPATSIAKGDGEVSAIVDYESLHPEKLEKSMKKLFTPLDHKKGDSLIIYGWAKPDYIVKHAGK